MAYKILETGEISFYSYFHHPEENHEDQVYRNALAQYFGGNYAEALKLLSEISESNHPGVNSLLGEIY